jgi:Glycosyl transferase family 2
VLHVLVVRQQHRLRLTCCDDVPVRIPLSPGAEPCPADVTARLDELSRQMAELASGLAELKASQGLLVGWQAEVRTRVRRTQALTARTYEGLQDWSDLLATARAEDRYELAFNDPDPLVSIPIPTYHSPETLCGRALASVLAQTHTNWEAIVVGDHCTDDTEARVQAIGDPRIRFHNLPVRENDPDDPWERWAVKGSVPRSVGVRLSRGLWIAPLSHDDAWDPDHIQTLLAAARAARAEVAYSGMRVVDAEAPGFPVTGTIGAYPPRLGQWGWQSAIFHGALRFLQYDRVCAMASEPNDWNLARRAWEAGVCFHHVPRQTVSLFVHDRPGEIKAALEAMGLPFSAAANSQ